MILEPRGSRFRVPGSMFVFRFEFQVPVQRSRFRPPPNAEPEPRTSNRELRTGTRTRTRNAEPGTGNGSSLLGLRNQPRTSLKREVRHRPLEEHDHPVPEANEHEDVQEQPRQPGEHPRQPDPAEVADGRSPSDDRHAAEIAIDERRRRLSPQSSLNRPAPRDARPAWPSARRPAEAFRPDEHAAASPTTNTSG